MSCNRHSTGALFVSYRHNCLVSLRSDAISKGSKNKNGRVTFPGSVYTQFKFGTGWFTGKRLHTNGYSKYGKIIRSVCINLISLTDRMPQFYSLFNLITKLNPAGDFNGTIWHRILSQ